MFLQIGGFLGSKYGTGGEGKGPRGGPYGSRAASQAWRRTSTSCSRRIRSRMLVGMAAARLLAPPPPPARARWCGKVTVVPRS